MSDSTTLVCLFHHEDHARSAIRDIRQAGVPDASILTIESSESSQDELDKSELASLGMPDRDYDHLKAGLRDGGIVISVSSLLEHIATVESIFQRHSAEKIDEAEQTVPPAPANIAAVTPEATAIPIVQEDLVVGKRTVDQGGVRLYRRVVEIPVEESINLREENVRIDRVSVDRPVTELDLAFRPRSIELSETVEEAVVVKEARVVEEIVVSKDAVEHTETINETLRHTEVAVEELPAGENSSGGAGRTWRN